MVSRLLALLTPGGVTPVARFESSSVSSPVSTLSIWMEGFRTLFGSEAGLSHSRFPYSKVESRGTVLESQESVLPEKGFRILSLHISYDRDCMRTTLGSLASLLSFYVFDNAQVKRFLVLLLVAAWRVEALVYRPGVDCEWISKLKDLNHTFLDQSPSINALDALASLQASKSDRRVCALVGNSPKLLERSYGNLIDESDVVLRINGGGVISSDRRSLLSVGKKMDVFIPNGGVDTHKIAAKLAHQPSYNGTIVSFIHKEFLKKLKKFIRLQQRCSRWWLYDVKQVENLLKTKLGKKPSSGSAALPLLMNFCSEIRVFGFSTCEEDSDADRYHDKRNTAHSYKAEVAFRGYLSYCVVDPTIAIYG